MALVSLIHVVVQRHIEWQRPVRDVRAHLISTRARRTSPSGHIHPEQELAVQEEEALNAVQEEEALNGELLFGMDVA